MSAEDLTDLQRDIEDNGQISPIVVFDGQVLDGWHRYRCCRNLRIEPKLELLPAGLDPVAFVMSCNLHRRHLTDSQRSLAVAECSRWHESGFNQHTPQTGGDPGSPPPVTVAQMAKTADVNERTQQRAKAVADKAVPEVKEAVREGRLSVKAAAEIAKLPADEQLEALHAPKPKKTKPLPAVELQPLPEVALQPTDPNAPRDLSEHEQLLKDYAETLADNDRMGAVFDADDRLKAAMDANKQLAAEVRSLRERMNGLMNEKGELIRLLKRAQAKLKKAGIA